MTSYMVYVMIYNYFVNELSVKRDIDILQFTYNYGILHRGGTRNYFIFIK